MNKYCVSCGEIIKQEGKFCPRCGKQISDKGAVALKQPEKKLQIYSDKKQIKKNE